MGCVLHQLKLVWIFLLCIFSNVVWGKDGLDSLRDRLRNELVVNDWICSKYLGPFGVESDYYAKADSLMKLVNLEEKLEILKSDSSYVLKYYAFRSVMYENDSMAETLLYVLFLNDSTTVSTHFTCVMRDYAFNELLVMEYWNFFNHKYKYGGTGTCGGEVVHFPPAGNKLWKKKRKRFFLLLEGSGNESLSLLGKQLDEEGRYY